MSKLAVLKFGEGSFESGFPVTLRLGNEEEPATLELDGYLPAVPTLLELVQTWQFSYRSRGSVGGFRQLKAPNAQITRQRSSLVAVSRDFVQAINQWLNGSDRSFQRIRDHLLKAISQGEEVRLIIQAQQLDLWQLPWHLWDLVQDHPNVDVAFSLGTFAAPDSQPHRSSTQVRILVLLGDSTNIDTQTDLQLLVEHLPEAEIHIPTQVQREQLCNDLWKQSWDILFFAGHSSSHMNEGRLYLNNEVYLTIDDLRYALRRAIANGLQLAIFNSCDGLELARNLADLQLPTAIVMRERIPDEAAQKFLQYFLDVFAQTDQSLLLTVREARERLHAALDDKYPCASWLLLVCQSPAVVPWCSHDKHRKPTPPPISKKLSWQTVLVTSLVVTGLVMGARSLGVFRGLELKAFDHLMQLRPIEGADPRLVIIKITDADVQEQLHRKEPGEGSLHDPTLQKLIAVLDKYQPRVIGIDIYHDQSITSGYTTLQSRLQDNQSPPIIGICQHANPQNNPPTPGIHKPPEIPIERIGFSDFSYDSDRVIRRQLLKLDLPVSRCGSSISFALQLALHYLKTDHIQPEAPSDEGSLKLKNVIFKRLESHVGGYQNSSLVASSINQILLNYRPYQNLDQIATSMTLSQVLDEQFNPDFIKDRVVLIGRTDTDLHTTPYNAEQAALETPGVYLHAQAVSQILAAVLDERSLINWLPVWGDFLWVCFWAVVGGILAKKTMLLRQNSQWLKTVGLITGTVLLYLWCRFFTIWIIVWFPLIPALIAFLTTNWAAIAWHRLGLQRKALRESNLISYSTHE